MNAAQVVPSHLQENGSHEIYAALAESVCQASEATKVHSHGEIRAFDVTCRVAFELGISCEWDWDSANNFRGVVPVGRFTFSLPIDFQQLRVIDVSVEVLLDCFAVRSEPIRSDMRTARDSLAQITDKIEGAGRIAPSNVVGEDKFCLAVECDECASVAPFLQVIGRQVALLGVYEAPNFVRLKESRAQIPDVRIENLLALLGDSSQHRKNCRLVNASEPRDRAHADSFREERADSFGLFDFEMVIAERLLTRFRKSSFTAGTAKTLDLMALSVVLLAT